MWCRRRERTFHEPTATTSSATWARACRSSRTRPRPACSSVAESSPQSWTGWILSTSTSSSFIPGSPATARPCIRAGCPARDVSSWSRRSRSAAAPSPYTIGAPADPEQPQSGKARTSLKACPFLVRPSTAASCSGEAGQGKCAEKCLPSPLCSNGRSARFAGARLAEHK